MSSDDGRITDQHVEALSIRETGDHGGNKGMARDGCQRVSLIPDMFYLLQSND